ncbi:hypothetical protein FXF51_20785 [Nonomuraea sp. PA05]|uniref:DUF6544 family protein n=1 Tax=Nonomuraea sp. PA05 TaxID=2604466 RepID=UPI0011D83378|nr:DUF6544 family protein [Nonomuraea sp. PA05]TYB64881.1 hypothetical protein FXF51_20785 [Nonomuraea sp. PA05]
MTVVLAPPRLTEQARQDWDLLQRPTRRPPAFDPDLAGLLPEPARRWLLHAIEPGTPLLRAVVLSMRGTIRLGEWHRFHANEALLPLEGYVWAGTASLGMTSVRGLDRYRAGAGETRWRMFGAFPMVTGGGPDVTRGAAGRLACELVLAPAAALDPRVRWKALDERHAVAAMPIGGEDHEVTLAVAPDGRLDSVTTTRWGAPGGTAYHEHAFGMECVEEGTFDGFTIPARVRGGWWPGTERWRDGESIHFALDDALFR